MSWDQLLLAMTGVTALWLVTRESKKAKRWAPVFGLSSQPLWFYTFWTHGQYGSLFLNVCYAVIWATAFYREWLQRSLV